MERQREMETRAIPSECIIFLPISKSKSQKQKRSQSTNRLLFPPSSSPPPPPFRSSLSYSILQSVSDLQMEEPFSVDLTRQPLFETHLIAKCDDHFRSPPRRRQISPLHTHISPKSTPHTSSLYDNMPNEQIMQRNRQLRSSGCVDWSLMGAGHYGGFA